MRKWRLPEPKEPTDKPVPEGDWLKELIGFFSYGSGVLALWNFLPRMPVYGWQRDALWASSWVLLLFAMLCLRDLSRLDVNHDH